MFRIALIESVTIVRYNLKDMLISGGYEVDDFTSVGHFMNLNLTQFEFYDLFIIDLRLPEREAYGLLKRIRGRKESSTLPIIITGAPQGRDTIMEAIQLGAADFLTKPFEKKIVLSRIRKTLSIYRPNSRKAAPQIITLDIDQLLRLEIARARRGYHPFSMIQLYFHTIDDTLGATMSETVKYCYEKLFPIGRQIDLVLSTDDALFILLPLTNKPGAEVFERKVVDALADLYDEHQGFYVEMGSASFPDHGEDVDGLLAYAMNHKRSLEEAGRAAVE